MAGNTASTTAPAGWDGIRGRASRRARREAGASLSVHQHLVLFAAGLVVPVTVFIGVLLWHFVAADQARYEAQGREMAHRLAVDLDRELNGLQSTLIALTTAQSLADGDLAKFHARAIRVRDALGVEVLLRDRAHQQLVNTRLPWGTPLPRGGAIEGERRALETRRPAVSDLFVGVVTGRPLVGVVVPVFARGESTGEVTGFLHVYVEAERFRDLFRRAGLPETWVASIVDRNGLVVTRSVRHEAAVGRPPSAAFRERPDKGREGGWIAPNPDGVMTLASYVRSDFSDWYAVVGVPLDFVQAPLRRSLLLMAALGLTLLAGSAGLALLFGSRIAGPIRMLAGQAAALGRGEAVERARTSLVEANEVGEALAVAGAALGEREERFRAFVEDAPSPKWIARADGSAEFFNRAWRAYTGQPAQPAGPSWTEAVHPDDRARFALLGTRATALGEPYAGELRLARAVDGAWRWHLVRVAPVRQAGRIAAWIGIAIDVDGIRAAEARLAGLNAELESRVEERTAALAAEMREREAAQGQLAQLQKLESIGQLTGGVAHDFNNLLMAVMSSLELLKKRLPAGDPRVTRLIDNAVQGAERGAALTQRLLAFARRQELKLGPVDVPALVRGMTDLMQRSLGPLVRIEARFPARLGPARADAHQLENALLNLAVNARDAMPGGGTLTIGAREEVVADGGEVAPGAYVVLGVADTGTGMDAATLRRATEPFFTTKGVGKGTGLGLSMVHGLAAQSGGRLLLRSAPGEGTTAELWLPRADAAPASTPAPAPGAPAAERARTVLLVDDDPLVLRGTMAMLDDLGHTAIEAHSGRQALELLRTGVEVDVVVTDYAMPGLTGAQLAAEVARLRPTLPMILATGYADLPDGAEPGLPRLAKPFRQADLAEAIERALAGGRDAGRAGPAPGAG